MIACPACGSCGADIEGQIVKILRERLDEGGPRSGYVTEYRMYCSYCGHATDNYGTEEEAEKVWSDDDRPVSKRIDAVADMIEEGLRKCSNS